MYVSVFLCIACISPQFRYFHSALNDSLRQTAIEVAVGSVTLEWAGPSERAESDLPEGAESHDSSSSWMLWSQEGVIEGLGATSRLETCIGVSVAP